MCRCRRRVHSASTRPRARCRAGHRARPSPRGFPASCLGIRRYGEHCYHRYLNSEETETQRALLICLRSYSLKCGAYDLPKFFPGIESDMARDAARRGGRTGCQASPRPAGGEQAGGKGQAPVLDLLSGGAGSVQTPRGAGGLRTPEGLVGGTQPRSRPRSARYSIQQAQVGESGSTGELRQSSKPPKQGIQSFPYAPSRR